MDALIKHQLIAIFVVESLVTFRLNKTQASIIEDARVLSMMARTLFVLIELETIFVISLYQKLIIKITAGP